MEANKASMCGLTTAEFSDAFFVGILRKSTEEILPLVLTRTFLHFNQSSTGFVTLAEFCHGIDSFITSTFEQKTKLCFDLFHNRNRFLLAEFYKQVKKIHGEAYLSRHFDLIRSTGCSLDAILSLEKFQKLCSTYKCLLQVRRYPSDIPPTY